MTPWAAKCRACWDEPHWRSTVVAGTDSGQPGGEHRTLRPTLKACSPTCDDAAHDHVVDEAGVEVVALARRLRASDGEVHGVPVPRSLPLRLPPGVRTASTMTACRHSIVPFVVRGVLPPRES